ncbi:hypothetical protein PVAP13_5NG620401 [Panicum virgatum]|uniref:Uncharacterized protein n=1 Tax=Panicum virgatum TaxID=38727 RepID=A0A8T0S699_PANVG|nr:hypothetical protein PVAP13_5NG620401 [Panicum virgatum]
MVPISLSLSAPDHPSLLSTAQIPLCYPLHCPAPISSIFSPSLLSPTPWRSGWWIEPMCWKLTAKVVWVMSSFIVCIAMAMITILSSCRSAILAATCRTPPPSTRASRALRSPSPSSYHSASPSR